MTKILFKNLPSKETPLNAQNLNQMQTNIENVITPLETAKITIKQLYYDSSAPSFLAQTLDDDITNYDFVTVFGKSSDGNHCSTTLYKPSVGDKINLSTSLILNNTIYNKQAMYEFSYANVIRPIQNYQLYGNTSIQGGDYITIKAVIGYKQGS